MLDTEYKHWFSRADIFICAVDNHPARRDLLHASKEMNKPCLIMANEYSTSQAMMYVPDIEAQYPMINPMLRYPEIQTSNTGSPISCQGDALESTPQLAIANQVSASLVICFGTGHRTCLTIKREAIGILLSTKQPSVN